MSDQKPVYGLLSMLKKIKFPELRIPSFFRKTREAVQAHMETLVAKAVRWKKPLLRTYLKFVRFADPAAIRIIEGPGSYLAVFFKFVLGTSGNVRATLQSGFTRLGIPFQKTGHFLREWIGSVRVEFHPSQRSSRFTERIKGRMETAEVKIHTAVLSARRMRIRHPSFFRVTAGLFLLFSGVMGACITFSAARNSQKVQVSVSAPAAAPMEEGARPSPLRIEFSAPAARLELLGRPVPAVLSPSVRGVWTFRNDRMLEFVPEEDWPAGQEYSVTLPPGIFAPGVEIADLKVEFETAPFTVSIDELEFYIDPVDPAVKKMRAVVSFSHRVDAADFEKRISMSIREEGPLSTSRSLKTTVSFDGLKGKAYVLSDVVNIIEKTQIAELRIESGLRAARGGETQDSEDRKTYVPGLYEIFKVRQGGINLVRNDHYELEQILVFETAARAKTEEVAGSLEIFLLPVDRPAAPGTEADRNHRWLDPSEIGAEVLAASVRINPEIIPAESDFSNTHSFRVQAPENRSIFVRIKKGTKSYGGFELAADFRSIYRIPAFVRELKIMNEGGVVSLSGEKKISLLSYDLEGVKFEVGRILPDQINHLVSQSEGNFNSPYFMNYYFSEDNITRSFTEERALQRSGAGRMQYLSFDFTHYLSSEGPRVQNGLFFFKAVSHNPRNPGEAQVSDRRLILVTDLGILVKDERDGGHEVYIQSFFSGQPVPGAKVEVIGKNGLPVVSATTDQTGRVRFPSLRDFRREKEPTAYIVRNGSDLSFMPYSREDRRLNYSRFEVAGVHGADQPDRLNAFAFSDRGIYRPGDQIHTAFIIKSGDWRKDLTGIPLEIAVTDPRGVEVHSKKIRLSTSGFEEINFATQESSPTGGYEFGIYIIRDEKRAQLLGSARVRVEEFLPDRLKITTKFSASLGEEEGWVHPKDLNGLMNLQNLYGSPAAEHRATGSISLVPKFPSFRGYQDYYFSDPLGTKQSFREDLEESTTNEKGDTVFPLRLDRFESGIYRVTFRAQGFEAGGGRSVSSESTVIVSPLSFIIGMKPDGDLSYINRGSRRIVSFVALDPRLQRIAAGGLKLRILEIRHVSSLVKRPDGTYHYQSVEKEIHISTNDFAVSPAGSFINLPTDQPGDFTLAVLDSSGKELNKIAFSVAGQGNLTRSLERNAELQIKLSKADFSPGEFIELEIRAPYKGAGLITIEKDRVYARQHFRTNTESSIQRIQVPQDIEGNGYVNVSFVRSLDSPEIYMSPLSYAIVPFTVSRLRRTNRITLNAPESAKPGAPFAIQYRSEKPGRVVIYAVDEGILQVARYKTPDPLAYFFQKRALEVETSQILDQLMPEFSLMQRLSRTGGDENDEIGANLNPFKRRRQAPVVYWSGIVETGPEVRQVVYNIPEYFNGRLRVMAVAVSSDAIGSSEKTSFIRDDFIITPSAPLFASPGDEFEVTVAVANQVRGSGSPSVEISAQASGSAEISGEALIQQVIGENSEKNAVFRIRVPDSPGEGSILFQARSGNFLSHQTASISVRPASPYISDIRAGQLRDESVEVPVPRSLYPNFRKLEVSVSKLPVGISSGLMNYLDSFPYGCTEQIVSRSFGALLIRDFPGLNTLQEKPDETIANALRVLGSRQTENGGFGLWSSAPPVSEFVSLYAMQFLTEAKEKGVAVPPRLFEKGLGYLNSVALNGRNSPPSARAYAVYLLTRNGRVTTNYVNSILQAMNGMNAEDRALPGMYLAASFEMMKQEKESLQWIDASRPEKFTEDFAFDQLSGTSRYLFLISRHFPMKAPSAAAGLLDRILQPLSAGRINTFSSAQAMMALEEYAKRITPVNTGASVEEKYQDGHTFPLTLAGETLLHSFYSEKARSLIIHSPSRSPLFYQVTEAGFDTGRVQPQSSGLEVSREFHDFQGNVIDHAEVGQEVLVSIRIRSSSSREISNIAVVDMLPGGFETVLDNARQDQTSSDSGGSFKIPGTYLSRWSPEYEDVREDRMLLFGRASKNGEEYTYRVRAVNPGHYSVPPLFAEGMYDRSVRALTPAASFNITPQARRAP